MANLCKACDSPIPESSPYDNYCGFCGGEVKRPVIELPTLSKPVFKKIQEAWQSKSFGPEPSLTEETEEKCIFSLNLQDTVVFGEEKKRWTAYAQPMITFKGLDLFCNVPCPGLVYIESIILNNINLLITIGRTDAFLFANACECKKHMCRRMPRLSFTSVTPANKVMITGLWTGLVPIGMICGAPFLLTFDFVGVNKLVYNR